MAIEFSWIMSAQCTLLSYFYSNLLTPHRRRTMAENLLTPHRRRKFAETMIFAPWRSLKLLIPIQNGLPRRACPAAWYVVTELWIGHPILMNVVCSCTLITYFYSNLWCHTAEGSWGKWWFSAHESHPNCWSQCGLGCQGGHDGESISWCILPSTSSRGS